MIDGIDVLYWFWLPTINFIHLCMMICYVWSVESSPFKDHWLWAMTGSGCALLSWYGYAPLAYIHVVFTLVSSLRIHTSST